MIRHLVLAVLLSFMGLTGPRALASSEPLTFDRYQKKPKLVIVFVIDQFRSDFLSRYQKDFRSVADLGFNYLMQNGAYFPQSNYEILQAMTCPGHAMILSGSHPAQTSIPLNEWYDTKLGKKVYCAEDSEYGLSPRRLKTTTVGDEIKNIYPQSKVYAVSVKDRSSIFLGGHRANLALWFDDDQNQWVTSKYYNQGQTPAWLKKFNDQQKAKPLIDKQDLQSAIAGTEATVEIALEILDQEKLGQSKGQEIDLLGISLSNHDILGHREGPDSENMKKLTLLEDQLMAKVLKKLKEKKIFDQTMIVLTADHGIPPVAENLRQHKIAAGALDYLTAIKAANEVLTDQFGSSGKKGWIETVHASHVYFNRQRMTEKKIDPAKMQLAAKKVFEKLEGIYKVVTRDEIMSARIPYYDLRWPLENSFVSEVSGDLILIPEPFYADKGKNTVTHMTSWNYDTTVPLIFWGPRWFKPKVLAGSKIIDIAPTLSFLLGTVPPAKARGRVLQEAIY